MNHQIIYKKVSSSEEAYKLIKEKFSSGALEQELPIVPEFEFNDSDRSITVKAMGSVLSFNFLEHLLDINISLSMMFTSFKQKIINVLDDVVGELL